MEVFSPLCQFGYIDRSKIGVINNLVWTEIINSTGAGVCPANSLCDGGRPSGLAEQAESPNHLKRLQSKAVVVNVHGKGSDIQNQVLGKKTNESEPPMRHRKGHDVVESMVRWPSYDRV